LVGVLVGVFVGVVVGVGVGEAISLLEQQTNPSEDHVGPLYRVPSR
jgi:hypothetical protein